ncbi:hypothetical protein Gpo141_00002312, partial [Globisporangium polare]
MSSLSSVTSVSKKLYALKIAGFSLNVIEFFDPTGFTKLIRAFAQEVYGPTQFFGEINGGNRKDSLVLNAIGKAFATNNGQHLLGSAKLETNKVAEWNGGSTGGTWLRADDPLVRALKKGALAPPEL